VTVIDSSILVGLLRSEADVLPLVSFLRDGACVVGAPTLAETLAWCAVNMSDGRSPWLEAWANRRNVTVVPFDHMMAQMAGEAFRRYGRMSGHAARLNFGDALAYATAAMLARPLLFKGADFGHTDIARHPSSILL
jgi:ribonuclease VapC